MLFANLTSLHLGYVMFVGQLLVPAFVMTGDASFGFASSPTGAGLYMLPTSAGMLVSVPVAGRLARRVRPSRLIAAGMALTGVGTAAFAVFHAHPWQVYAANSLRGLGLGLVVALMPLLVLAAADPKRTGVATGLNNVLRTVGGLAGAQISAALLAALTIAGSERPAEIGFLAAMWASTGVSLAGAWLALLVTGRAAAGAAPETAARPLTPPAGGLPLRRSG
jgi:MFS family permease